MKKLMVLGLGLAIAGCSTNQYKIDYVSNPSGAELICNGKSYGYLPTQLHYTLTEDQMKNGGHLTLPECYVRWVSGAKVEMDNMVNLGRFPYGITRTINRPVDYPAAEKDHMFALELQRNQAIINAQRAVEDAAENINSSSNTHTNTLCVGLGGNMVSCSTH